MRGGQKVLEMLGGAARICLGADVSTRIRNRILCLLTLISIVRKKDPVREAHVTCLFFPPPLAAPPPHPAFDVPAREGITLFRSFNFLRSSLTRSPYFFFVVVVFCFRSPFTRLNMIMSIGNCEMKRFSRRCQVIYSFYLFNFGG